MKIWKPVVGFEGIYEVSNDGEVKTNNFANTGMEMLLRPQDNNGYRRVTFQDRGVRKHYLVHRIVAEAFIPNLKKKPQINHINGIKHDNRVENLEWCTNSENQIHLYSVLGRVPSFLGKKGSDHNCFGKIGKLHHSSIEIHRFTTEGEYVGSFESISLATQITGIRHLSEAVEREGFAGGYLWSSNRHKKDFDYVPYKTPEEIRNIGVYSKDGTLEATFQTLAQTAEYLGVGKSTVCIALKGKRKTCGGKLVSDIIPPCPTKPNPKSS